MNRLVTALAITILGVALVTPFSALAQDNAKFPIPELRIRIPGVTNVLTEAVSTDCPEGYESNETEGCLAFPWIGQYISSLYIFGVYAATILSAIVIMVAGFLWLTSGVNTNQIGSAKSYILGAILGLMLMLGSYTVLRLVNPNLVQFTALRIPVLKRVVIQDYAKALYQAGAVVASCVGAPRLIHVTLMPSEYVDYFNNAGTEFGIDPVFLAAIARQESRFNPGAESPVGAYGITQIMPRTASEIWSNYPQISRPGECSGTDDPGRGQWTQRCKDWMKNNPREAIRMQAAYFRTINARLERCNLSGNTTLMAAGYNAGPYRRDICRGEVPPLTETQDYVKKVKGFHEDFCKQSGGNTVEPPPPDFVGSPLPPDYQYQPQPDPQPLQPPTS